MWANVRLGWHVLYTQCCTRERVPRFSVLLAHQPPPPPRMPPPSCWICLEEDSCRQQALGPLQRGCACRGDAGYAHMACLADWARAAQEDAHNSQPAWTRCPTCKQDYTGDVQLCLARARWGHVANEALDSPERLAASAQLASALCECSNDLETARPLMEQTLQVQRRTKGDEHQHTLATMNNLGHLLRQLGEFSAAHALYEEALATRRRTLGDQHPSTVICLNNVAVLHSSRGDHASARPIMEASLRTLRSTLGDAHPRTLATISNLGSLLLRLDDHSAARPLIVEVLDVEQRVLGTEHPDTLLSLRNLAECDRCMQNTKVGTPTVYRGGSSDAGVHSASFAAIIHTTCVAFAKACCCLLGKSRRCGKCGWRARLIRWLGRCQAPRCLPHAWQLQSTQLQSTTDVLPY
jgi:tetratricopeptide (TPR) repeat protein